ncbi:hypothetical protein [Nannocystis bainbridge]|uniref:DUF892 family protein n=1 Tax=Nannocystis bainbridge TaxID=2995303 RepID=A0ABT5EBA0_9BACT|nr:hypothetical protein [Nannocystis bainbridge]MDC0723141.1 hypothetical protein [Nannocystis bainbridge]
MNEKTTATLTTYITDMHALVNHGLRAIDRQARMLTGSNHLQALGAVQEFQRTLENHRKLLDARAEALGGKVTQPFKDAVTTVTGFLAGLTNRVRPLSACKAIRDDYTYLSHVAVSYLMLFTTANGLGDSDTALLAEQGYRDAARMVMHIDRILPSLVAQELREHNLPIADLEHQSRTMLARAWKREESELGLESGAIA